jgi:hypothetical protein
VGNNLPEFIKLAYLPASCERVRLVSFSKGGIDKAVKLEIALMKT